MNTTDQHDVIVGGGEPAGSTAAALLAPGDGFRRYKLVVIDRVAPGDASYHAPHEIAFGEQALADK